MARIKLSAFGGMAPVQDPRLLPESFATLAENTSLYGGTLAGHRYPTKIRDLTDPTAKRVYRIPVSTGANSIDDESVWMEFTDADTNVVKAAVTGDSFRRFYWAAPSHEPRYNTFARIQSGASHYKLGIPAPTVAPAVTPSGGMSTVLQTRAYVYTWVSDFGEEGPPSPPTTVTSKVDATYGITLTAPGSGVTTGRSITKVRIYRTITGLTGATNYFRVTELPIATTAHNDTATDNTVSQNTILRSSAWYPPPETLQGIVALPNGILAGWTGQDLYFSESYRPHAWPPTYSIAVDFPIVGLGVFGNSLIVCTAGAPSVVYGSSPGAMGMTKTEVSRPCLSRRSILSAADGVYYAAQDGLVRVVPGSVATITETLFSKQNWQQEVDPENLCAVQYRTGYMAWSVPPSAKNAGFLIDASDPRLAYTRLSDVAGDLVGAYEDEWSGEIMVVGDGAVWRWDPPAQTIMIPYVWQSKEFETPYPENFGAMRISLDTSPGSPTAGSTMWSDAFSGLLGAAQTAVVRVYADGTLRLTREFTDQELIRLPSGYKARVWQIKIAARTRVRSVQMATTEKELRDV